MSAAPALRQAVLEEVKRIAPELDERGIDERRALREQVDLDSMDWVNFFVALNERFGLEIPEADYPRLGTLEAIVEYLGARLA